MINLYPIDWCLNLFNVGKWLECLEACVLASHRLCLIFPLCSIFFGSSLPSLKRGTKQKSAGHTSFDHAILWYYDPNNPLCTRFFLTMAKLEDGETAGHCTKGVRLPLGVSTFCVRSFVFPQPNWYHSKDRQRIPTSKKHWSQAS